MQRVLSWLGVALSALIVMAFVLAAPGKANMDNEQVLIAQYMNASSAVGTLILCGKRDPTYNVVGEAAYNKLRAIFAPHIKDSDTLYGRMAALSWIALQQTLAKQQYLDFDPEAKMFVVRQIEFPETCGIAQAKLEFYLSPGGILDVKDNQTDLKSLEQAYLAQGNAYADMPTVPVHERWTYVLRHLPEVAKLGLTADHTALWERAYKSGSFHEAAAAYELAVLRGRFFLTLRSRGAILPHVFRHEYENANYWAVRLSERLQSSRPFRRRYGKIRKSVVPEKVTHTWLN